jgi:hypothetical protein
MEECVLYDIRFVSTKCLSVQYSYEAAPANQSDTNVPHRKASGFLRTAMRTDSRTLGLNDPV